MNSTRPYRMRARAEAVRETRNKIVSAATEACLATNYDDIQLQGIAERSGVSVQTVIRHFGSKERLFAAAFEEFSARITARMDLVEVGDIRGAIETLHERYEWMGDGNIRMLAQEESVGPIAEVMREARTVHRKWVERILAPYLPPERHPDREKRLLQFLIVCDVYTWKLLRRDHGADRETTTAALVELATALIRSKGEPDE